MTTYYEDRSGWFRDVDYPVDPAAERAFAEARIEDADRLLDVCIGTGRLTLGERKLWRDRLLRDFDVTRDILLDMRQFADEGAHNMRRDRRLIQLQQKWDDYLDIEEPVREFSEEDALPQSEREWRQAARAVGLDPATCV